MSFAERHAAALKNPVIGSEGREQLLGLGLHDLTPLCEHTGLLTVVCINRKDGEPTWLASLSTWDLEQDQSFPLPIRQRTCCPQFDLQRVWKLAYDLLSAVGEGETTVTMDATESVLQARRAITAEERGKLWGGQ